MVDKLKNLPSRTIIIGTAIILTAVFLLNGCISFLSESSARKDGSLLSKKMSVIDFVWNGIAEKEGVIITTDNDPQLILDGEQKFSSLRFYMESTAYPGEMVIYYTEKGDAGFSVQKRLWIVPDSRMNWYIVKTPMKSVTSLRIDPTMYAGNILEFGDFIFNEEKSLGDYFDVSYGDIFNLVIYTGIISSVLKFLQEILKKQID